MGLDMTYVCEGDRLFFFYSLNYLNYLLLIYSSVIVFF